MHGFGCGLVAMLVAAGCRLGFDPIAGDGSVADTVGAVDAVGAGTIDVTIVGHGAVVATGLACADHCSFSVAGTTVLGVVADEGWTFQAFSAPCGAASSCTAAVGATITATFQPLPITANVAFVTSVVAPTSSGRAALDAFCQTRATSAGMSGSFVALVSTSTQSAASRLAGSRGWVRVDGLPVIDQPSDLGLATPPRGIELDELEASHVGDSIVTGSNTDGTYNPGTSCGDWTTTTGGNGGFSDGAGAFMLGQVGTGCITRVYCFELGKLVAVALRPTTPFPAGRYVFITENAVGSGLAGADAKCQADASAAGLPGNYAAVLAMTTQSALAHVGELSGTWRRPDGIVVTYGGLDHGPYQASLAVHADATPVNDFLTLLGAATLTDVGVASTTCDDWTNAAGTASTFYPLRDQPFTMINPSSCGFSVACVQEL